MDHPVHSSGSSLPIQHKLRFVLVSTLLALLLLALSLLVPAETNPSFAADALPAVAPVAAAPQAEWLEPRGLSIASLVGLVPEDHLRDAIIAYRPGYGLVQYLSGERSGDTVTVNAKLTPRYLTFGNDVMTRVGCLGQMGVYDEWMSAVPAANIRIFAAGADVTSNAVYTEYAYAGQKLPDANVSNYFRYDMYKGNPTFATDGALAMPANMGCTIVLRGRHTNLTATFTFQDSTSIQVEVLGSETFPFHSYIGVGNAGQLDALRDQMVRRYGNRHDKFFLNPPEGTDYFFVAFPPTPAEPYPDTMESSNVPLAASGTYRIGRTDNTLSVDHVASMAMPLYGQWQDADQADGDYLRFFNDGVRIASPEYFVPAGVGYNSCMTSGGCSDTFLDQLFATEMQLTVYYYRVSRVADVLTRIPLRQVGSRWSAAVAQQATVTNAADRLTAAMMNERLLVGEEQRSGQRSGGQDEVIYLPIIQYPVQPTPLPQVPPDDANGCPCGWFDSIGRMVDYIPPTP